MDKVIALGTKKATDSLRPRLRERQVTLSAVSTPRALLNRLRTSNVDLVLLDSALPDIPARKLLEDLKDLNPALSIIITDLNTLDIEKLSGFFASGQRKDHLLEELHNPDSGRIDANRTADFFGLSLSRFAKILGRSPQSVHKTPDAQGLQQKLTVFVRIASALLLLGYSHKKAKAWLNAPHPDLDNTPPAFLVEQGKAQIVAGLLEDALLGHPG